MYLELIWSFEAESNDDTNSLVGKNQTHGHFGRIDVTVRRLQERY